MMQPARPWRRFGRNTGTTFTNSTISLTGIYSAAFAWGDYDNDTKLDFVIMGYNASSGPLCQVWRNISLQADTPPDRRPA